jgi:hypothetical protein
LYNHARTDALTRIKRLVLRGAVRYSKKARWELICDGLFESDVAESILNAPAIYKTLRIAREEGEEVFYLLISSKIATTGD